MKNRVYLAFIMSIFSIVVIANMTVIAHKVNIFAYIEGQKVYTESYFNDGAKCINSKVEVFDSQENKLLEGLTDREGMFSFEIPAEGLKSGGLKLVLTAGMGHRAERSIPASELNDVVVGTLEENPPEDFLSASQSEVSSLELEEVRTLIENTLDEKLAPIMREIKKSQEDKISTTEIVGGIGYIIGIFGIIAYFLSRKR
jgi:nickel transport protein